MNVISYARLAELYLRAASKKRGKITHRWHAVQEMPDGSFQIVQKDKRLSSDLTIIVRKDETRTVMFTDYINVYGSSRTLLYDYVGHDFRTNAGRRNCPEKFFRVQMIDDSGLPSEAYHKVGLVSHFAVIDGRSELTGGTEFETRAIDPTAAVRARKAYQRLRNTLRSQSALSDSVRDRVINDLDKISKALKQQPYPRNIYVPSMTQRAEMTRLLLEDLPWDMPRLTRALNLICSILARGWNAPEWPTHYVNGPHDELMRPHEVVEQWWKSERFEVLTDHTEWLDTPTLREQTVGSKDT